MSIKKNLVVTVFDATDPRELAGSLATTDFGEVLIKTVGEAVLVSLDDIEEAVSELRDFSNENKREVRPTVKMLEDVIQSSEAALGDMVMEFGEAAEKE